MVNLQAVAWFTGCQGSSRQLQYIPELHGTVCEWLSDMIAIPAEKNSEACGSGSLSSEVRCGAQELGSGRPKREWQMRLFFVTPQDIITMAKKLRESFTIIAKPSALAAKGLIHR